MRCALLFLVGCARTSTTQAVRPEPPVPSATESPPPTVPLEPIVGLPPARILHGPSKTGDPATEPDFAQTVEVLHDTSGDGLPELLVSTSFEDLVIPSPLAAGELDAIVAARLPEQDAHQKIASADMDRDGYGDVWLEDRLFLGPFAGDHTADEPAARIGEPRPGGGDFFETGFDADGDGWLDLAMGNDLEQLVVYYGPFSGTIDGDGATATITESGDGCELYLGGTTGPWVLGAVNHPGEVVVVTGKDEGVGCSAWAYDVAGPRGQRPRFASALAEFGSTTLEPWPDANGDGLTDVLYLWNPVFAPIEGYYFDANDYGTGYHEERVLSFQHQQDAVALPDVTGDGLGDILIEVHPDLFDLHDPEWAWYVVPGTTLGTGLDPDEHGVRLASIPEVNPADPRSHPFLPVWKAADFDGDGLAEVVASQKNVDLPGPSGWVWIYLGADIATAYEALEAPETP